MGGALIKADVIFERDLTVPMRDGVILSANLFRPVDGKPAPVVMSVTPYGKDKRRDRLITFFMRLTGVRSKRSYAISRSLQIRGASSMTRII
jgi:predicted acyl esterase